MGARSRPARRLPRHRILVATVGGLLFGGSLLAGAPGAYAAGVEPTAVTTQFAAAAQPQAFVEVVVPARHLQHHHRVGRHHQHSRVSPVRSRAFARRVIHNPTQFGCFSDVIARESGWNPRARNRSSGAYGIPQALPARKLARAGRDWRTNPRTQIRWAVHYMHHRYSSPCGAWRFWRHHHWY